MTDLYEILGIDPRATTEQVDRAYRFSLEMYGEAALATYSLLGPHELAEMRARIEVAYRVLKDPVRRQHYDESSGGTPASLPLPFPAPQSTPSVPEPTPSVSPLSPVPGRQEVLPEPVTGADLRRFREERGIRLQDIASASKIGMRFLDYIEGERFSLLPAPVYLRSFLYEYAKAVGLEPRRTADSYMTRVPRQV
ncbi:MAG TPA: helix-turn-helix domain-containing protein [Vicinamibacteria bacterium]|nr:helix-turn-helix domain-containing protein [Vicinamibacteria bacterium]